MKIDVNKIEKLKIIKINKNNLIVQNNKGQKGIVYISNISNNYIVDIYELFKINDIVYGYLEKIEEMRRFYTLKVLHGETTRKKRPIGEVGGGSLGCLYLVNKLKPKENI